MTVAYHVTTECATGKELYACARLRLVRRADAEQAAGGAEEEVSVSGADGGPWTIDFNEPGDWGQISAQGKTTFSGVINPATTTEGGISNQEIQRLDHTGTEGVFRLSFGGETTRPIAHDASVADVEQALNELATVQATGGVKVTAAPGGDPLLDTVNVSGDVILDATSDGNFYVFSLAASIRTKGDDGDQSGDAQDEVDPEDPLDGETLPALFGDAEGAPTEDDEGNPVGGRVEALGNFEIRVRVVGNFGVVLFTDAGGVWRYLDEVSLDTAGFGTGFGLRYHTMFGPVRLDYGFAPTWRNSLKRGRIYLGIGHVF